MKYLPLLLCGIIFIAIFDAKAQNNLDFKEYDFSNNSYELNRICGNSVPSDIENGLSQEYFSNILSTQSISKYYTQSQERFDNISNKVAFDNAALGTVVGVTKFGNSIISDLATSYVKHPLGRIIIKTREKAFNNILDAALNHTKNKGVTNINNTLSNEVRYIATIARNKNLSENLNNINSAEALSVFYEKLNVENENLPSTNKFLISEAFKLIKNQGIENLLTNVELQKYEQERNDRFSEFEEEVTTKLAQFQNTIFKSQANTFEAIDKLNTQINANKNDIALNSFKIESLTAFYNFDKKSLQDRLSDLKNGKMDKFITSENKSDLINDLETLKFNQDVIQVASSISEWSGVGIQASQALEAFGVLSQKDAANASEALGYLGNAANAVAGFYTGNYAGMVSSVISMFGSGKPKKSPEMQMLEMINRKLDKIGADVKEIKSIVIGIDKKIVQLGSMIESLHSNMMAAFELSFKEFEYMKDVIEANNRLLVYIGADGFSNCSNLDKIKLDLDDYSSLKNFYERAEPGDCKKCFDAVKSILDQNLLLANDIEQNPLFILQYINNVNIETIEKLYSPMKKILAHQYGNSNTQIIYQNLLYPPENTLDNALLSLRLNKLKRDKNDKILNVLSNSSLTLGDKLLNAYAIKEVGHLYKKYFVFIEISKGENYKPRELSDLLANPYPERMQNHKDRIKNYLSVLETAIIQQSLLSGLYLEGTFYNFLNSYNNENSFHELSIELLNSNEMARINFGLHILRREYLQKTEIFTEWFSNSESGDFLILSNKKNQMKKNEDESISLVYNFDDTTNSELTISSIPWSSILSGRRIYPSILMNLISLRETYINMLIDIEYRTNVNSKNKNENVFFNYQILEDLGSKTYNFSR